MAITVDVANLGTGFASSGLTVSLTTGSAVAANGFIVVGISEAGDTTALSTVADGSLTWTIDKNAGGGDSGGFRTYFASAQAPAGLAGGTVITATWPGGFGGVELIIGATSLLGVKTSSPVDGTPTDAISSGATTAWVTPSLTLQDGSIMFGMSTSDNDGGGNTPTGPSVEAWEKRDAPNLYSAVMEYRIEAVGGPFTVAGTWGASGNVEPCGIAYLAGPPAPPAGDTTTRRYQPRTSRMTSW